MAAEPPTESAPTVAKRDISKPTKSMSPFFFFFSVFCVVSGTLGNAVWIWTLLLTNSSCCRLCPMLNGTYTKEAGGHEEAGGFGDVAAGA